MGLLQPCPLLIFLLLAFHAQGASHKSASDAELKIEVRRLRAKLISAGISTEDGSGAGNKLGDTDAKADTWDATLEDVKDGIESDQHLEGQLKESSSSASWLTSALENATSQVKRISVRESEAGKRVRIAERATKASRAEVERKDGQIKQFRSHERTLEHETSNMLMADKELQKQADSLTHEMKKLKGKNVKLKASNVDLARREEQDKKEMVAAAEDEKTIRSELQEAKEEKEALSTFFSQKKEDTKKVLEKARAEAEVNASSQEHLVTELKKNMTSLRNDESSLKATLSDARSREHQVEDDEAAAEASAKEAEEQRQSLLLQLEKHKKINGKLRGEKAELVRSSQASRDKVKATTEESRLVKAQTCKTMQRRFADALNTKTKMHASLDQAVKLGRRLASDNKKLRATMTHTKEKLAELSKSGGDLSDGLRRQIKELHRQISSREQGLAAKRHAESSSTPAAAFHRNSKAALVAHSVATSNVDKKSLVADDTDFDLDTPPSPTDLDADMPPDPLSEDAAPQNGTTALATTAVEDDTPEQTATSDPAGPSYDAQADGAASPTDDVAPPDANDGEAEDA